MDAVIDQLRRAVRPDAEDDFERRRINCHHNFTAREHHHGRDLWLTRKGAIKAGQDDEGVIPGSMGTASYIVQGMGSPGQLRVVLPRCRSSPLPFGRTPGAVG